MPTLGHIRWRSPGIHVCTWVPHARATKVKDMVFQKSTLRVKPQMVHCVLALPLLSTLREWYCEATLEVLLTIPKVTLRKVFYNWFWFFSFFWHFCFLGKTYDKVTTFDVLYRFYIFFWFLKTKYSYQILFDIIFMN